MHLDGYRRIGSTLVKFKRKGGLRTGVTLGEAMSNVHLSGNESFSFYDLNADHRGKIVLKIRVRSSAAVIMARIDIHCLDTSIVDWIHINDIRVTGRRL